MLVEKCESVNPLVMVPLEQGKVLGELDQLLEEDTWFQDVKGDLARRHPHTLAPLKKALRRSTPFRSGLLRGPHRHRAEAQEPGDTAPRLA